LIPDFDKNDNLPAGIHWSTLEEIKNKLCFSKKRIVLITGLESAIDVLSKVGCETVYIDGSFTTTKEEPNDIDVCWDIKNVNLNKLHILEPTLLDFNDGRKNQKLKFGCEFFPADWIAKPPDIIFIDFFQNDRNNNPKGLIGIKL